MSTVMEPTTAAEAVANGAQLLDERRPGWWRAIDLETLNLSDCGDCVCGQLAVESGFVCGLDRYQYMMRELGLVWLETDRHYGFNLGDEDKTKEEVWAAWKELEAEWHKVIQARLQADALVPTPTKEEALAS